MTRPSFSGSPLTWALFVGACLLVPTRLSAADGSSDKVISPFLKQHCVECHGEKKRESGVRLDQIIGVQHSNRHLWTMIHEKISSGEMPPSFRRQPVEADKKRFLAEITLQQRALGLGGTRRLNRRELASALQDVTGMDIDFATALPGDGKVGGFDTGAEALQEASDAVAQWLVVTRRAVEGIRFLEPAPTRKYTFNFREFRERDTRKAFDGYKAEGVIVKAPRGPGMFRTGEGLLIEPKAVGERQEMSFTSPVRADRQGVFRLTLEVSAMKPMSPLPNPRLWVRIGGKDLDYREITAVGEQSHKLVYEVALGDLAVQSKGLTISLSNKVEIPYAVKGYENEDRSNPKDPPPGGTGLYRPLFDRKKTPPDKQPAPYVVLHRVEMEPDVVRAWPPTQWKADIGAIKDDPASAERLLALWMDRAWRRSVQQTERAPFVKLYRKLRDEGRSFDDALRGAFQSVLLSVPFRYQASPSHPEAGIAQHAIASRLSFMLWGTPPDAELRRLAVAGKLRDPAVLDAQVDRLLADPRSEGFVRPVVMQWLEMDQPITIAQSHIQKMDFRFARYLKESMREETLSYVGQLIAQNRPAGELIVSDWTMMNDALARHYGYPAIEGGQLRKVTLRKDDPRGGGILGHAGIQSMLCWMGENWVIYRGAWTLRHILDKPPPPPPLEVPELNPSEGKNKGKPFRELLKQHQQDARCSVCHKYIDPVGFAFQNFDLSGRLREVEHESYARSELDGRIAWRGVGKTRPVDTTGTLPRGESFKTFAEFKQVLVENYQPDLVRGLLKNFMIYGTGHKPGIDTMEEIRTIMQANKEKGYPLRDLLKAVVRSRAFLEQTPTPSRDNPSNDRKPK